MFLAQFFLNFHYKMTCQIPVGSGSSGILKKKKKILVNKLASIIFHYKNYENINGKTNHLKWSEGKQKNRVPIFISGTKSWSRENYQGSYKTFKLLFMIKECIINTSAWENEI